MAMRQSWIAEADERGAHALRVVHAALRDDGMIDRTEAPAVITSIVAWKRASHAARVAKSLADCVEHRVDIGPYFDRRVHDYIDAVDDVPEAS